MEEHTSLDPKVVIAILQYATACVGLVVGGITIIGGIAFYRAQQGTARTFSLLIQRADATRLIAVMAIVVAAFVLAMLDKINATGVVSILSGIAGYVLGGANATSGRDGDKGKDD